MPLEILLCHRALATNDQGVPDEYIEYTSNFEHFKSLIAHLFPEPYYRIRILPIDMNSATTLKFPLINFNPPIVIFYERNEPYGRNDDLDNYASLIEHSRYFVLAKVYDPLKVSYDTLKKYFFDSWRTRYKDHFLRDKIQDILIIDKNAPPASFNLLMNQATYANFSGLSDLSDAQAIIMLHALNNLLIRGPLNDIISPYNIKLGGVKDEITQVTFPTHIHAMLTKIKAALLSNNPAEAKQQLLQIVNDIKETALSLEKPFSRSSSTHDFYIYTLPLFIVRSIQKANIEAKEKITKLSEVDAEEILNIFAQYLLKDSSGTDRAYELGFFGGRKNQITREDGTTIKTRVPEHIFQLLNSLRNPKPESHKEKLSKIFDDILVTADSRSSSRQINTIDFYTNILPWYIVKSITEKQPEYANDSEQQKSKLR